MIELYSCLFPYFSRFLSPSLIPRDTEGVLLNWATNFVCLHCLWFVWEFVWEFEWIQIHNTNSGTNNIYKIAIKQPLPSIMDCFLNGEHTNSGLNPWVRNTIYSIVQILYKYYRDIVLSLFIGSHVGVIFLPSRITW